MPDAKQEMSVVIKVENLSKHYRLGVISGGTLREDLNRWFAKLQGKPEPLLKIGQTDHGNRKGDQVWALKDVNFEVRQGEILGIIGRNGAGKSTLLKILSRITAPTEGRIGIKGRVGSLLEVGTGFHPELTGRENIFLNGTILGMKKAEVDRKLDEIVEFAEMAKFIDTPVKRYSSGMRVRLAFAVAAHLEPEILIVDEVLAVGDAAFQKKCLGKMSEVSSEGRTILFVSHNMQSIRALCSRGLVLQAGSIVADGPVFEAVDFYNRSVGGRNFSATTSIADEIIRRGSGAVRFEQIEVADKQENKRFVFGMGEEVRFKLSYKVFDKVSGLSVMIALRSGKMGEIITTMRHNLSAESIPAGTKGNMELKIPELSLRPGEYQLYFWLGNKLGQPLDVVDGLLPPIVVHADGDIDLLGFDPTNSVGFFSIPSLLSANTHK